MKTKRLVLISCFAAATLIASPAFSNPPQKKTVVTSKSAPQRMAARTTQVQPAYRSSGTRYYRGTHYSGRTRYYNGGARYYGGGTQYYYGGGLGNPYYSYSYWPYSTYGYYPYASYGDYPYSYSYYSEPAYGDSVAADVQRRLAELGYYHGVIDGIIGPQTRAAIAAYESTHNLVVDGAISPRLLNRMGVS